MLFQRTANPSNVMDSNIRFWRWGTVSLLYSAFPARKVRFVTHSLGLQNGVAG